MITEFSVPIASGPNLTIEGLWSSGRTAHSHCADGGSIPPRSTMEEYFDIVDENNVPTGERKLRSEAHKDGSWHRVVPIYVFRKSGQEIEFLVHFRSDKVDANPNKWDTRFGGHIKADQTIEQSFADELLEETGLWANPAKVIKDGVYKKDFFPNREFSNVFYYEFSGDLSELKFNDGEVQEVKWLKSSEIIQSMEESPVIWSASKKGFLEILEVLKDKLKIK